LDASLLRAVLDAPEEDAPRFACAAWLEAHGDRARAELIRVQLALAGMVPDDPDGAALRARQGALLRAHLDAWHEALPELSEALAWEDPRRGFVEGVSAVPTEELPRRAEELPGGRGALASRDTGHFGVAWPFNAGDRRPPEPS
jgi:uncharacterized protein (TIGR02996 family)